MLRLVCRINRSSILRNNIKINNNNNIAISFKKTEIIGRENFIKFKNGNVNLLNSSNDMMTKDKMKRKYNERYNYCQKKKEEDFNNGSRINIGNMQKLEKENKINSNESNNNESIKRTQVDLETKLKNIKRIPKLPLLLGSTIGLSIAATSVVTCGLVGLPMFGIDNIFGPVSVMDYGFTGSQLTSVARSLYAELELSHIAFNLFGAVHAGLAIGDYSEKSNLLSMGSKASKSSTSIQSFRYFMGVSPIVASLLLKNMFPQSINLICLMMGMVGQLVGEIFLLNKGKIPIWYIRLKIPLTLLILASVGSTYLVLTKSVENSLL
eukprot:TRINITY_DN6317_c0_g1_i1.p1 TRINITY_DN6317_c0_g1~~TRINITY_DN6317_c0_g1_i1.p1  ORF type:complete len:323 (-),score=70.08 TRINITY_DN6317_c0_g1_i1:171-1139(-)